MIKKFNQYHINENFSIPKNRATMFKLSNTVDLYWDLYNAGFLDENVLQIKWENINNDLQEIVDTLLEDEFPDNKILDYIKTEEIDGESIHTINKEALEKGVTRIRQLIAWINIDKEFD